MEGAILSVSRGNPLVSEEVRSRKCVPESASQKVRSRSPVDPPPDSAAARAAGSRSVVAATA